MEAVSMTIRLGDEPPDFSAETTDGPIDFHSWKQGKWAVLFSHPKDFTPVCTTELGAVAKLKPGVRPAGHEGHRPVGRPHRLHHGWQADIEDTQGVKLNFPLIADSDRKDRRPLRHDPPNADDTFTVRSVFVIGPDNKVKLTLTYPASTGRNFDELLRVIDSLQLTANYSVATPADWKNGDDVIIVPAVSDEAAKEKFPLAGGRPPYLRITKQPNKT